MANVANTVNSVGNAVSNEATSLVEHNTNWLKWVGGAAIVAVALYLLEHFTLGWF